MPGFEFWFAEFLKIAVIGGVAYGCGLLVQKCGVKVNYTRKVNFFALYAVPFLVDRLLPEETSTVSAVLRTVFLMVFMAFFIRPVRERLPIAATMFLSYDRPEDRPHTMLWLCTQLVAGYAVLIPMSIWFRRLGFPDLIFIPILVHGLGDGFAEPIGVRFGKHKYATHALFSSRKYTRSLEGSACVYIAGVLAVLLFHGSFTASQIVAALLLVPLGMTLAEAFSPHTWDTPLMFLVGTTLLIGVMWFA